MSRSRLVLPALLSTSLALGGVSVMLADPGGAAPLPTDYSAKVSADLWRVNALDRDLTDAQAAVPTDLSVFSVDGTMSSTTNPRARAGSYNLSGTAGEAADARRGVTSEATRTTDTGAPATGIAPGGAVADTLDLGQATLGAGGRWVGDKGCLTTADGLTDGSASGAGASLASARIPTGSSGGIILLPDDIPTEIPTALPSSTATGLPTSLPTGLPTTTDGPTIIPTELPSDLPTTGLPTLTLPPVPTISVPTFPRRGTAMAQGAAADVVMASVHPGSVQQRVDLPVRNGASGDDRGVRAQAIGSVKDASAPAMTFFGDEVEVRVNGVARLTAFADGVHASVVDWTAPTVTVTAGGTTYALPTSGNPVVVPWSRNKDVTVSLSAGQLTQTVNGDGLVARAATSVLHAVVRNGDAVALDTDLMPMTVEAKAPGGGVECPAPDTDGDGLSDALEDKLGTNKGVKDTDHDRLGDGKEHYKYRTNPLRKDTDRDRLIDGLEVKKYRTKPRKPDTDRDHLKDGVEVRKYKTNPRKKDTDGDGVNDNVEIRRGTNPLHK